MENKELLRQEFIDNGFDSYVFYTLSNSETDLAEELNGKYDDVLAIVLKRLIHRSNRGKKWDEESILIKGYVFIYVPKDYDIREVRSDNNPFRILKWQLDYGKLFGDDYRYSEWVLIQNGLIGMSKAIKINSKVKIVSGPLSDLEGYIVEYSPRNRNCCVELTFMNQKIRTWLPFEYTDQNYLMDK